MYISIVVIVRMDKTELIEDKEKHSFSDKIRIFKK